MDKNTSVLFLTLKIFSSTGGIEKVCRVAGKALTEICDATMAKLTIYSLHDSKTEAEGNKYFPSQIFRGFNADIKKFIVQSFIKKRGQQNIVLLSHINLLIVGYMIKLFSPGTKLILIAHGIEVWPPLKFRKRMMLKKCDKILAVSNFTREKILEENKFLTNRLVVLNNCLDPFLTAPDLQNCNKLLSKYGLNKEDRIIIAVTRYSNKEKYKGYDHVIRAMANTVQQIPNLHYLLVGKYDAEEKDRIDKLVENFQLNGKIIFTGFVPEEELADHFMLADAFVMPSEKEGFGLVFIEAIFYGLPVVAGNKDGTCDALLNGKLGTLVTPGDIPQLVNVLQMLFSNLANFKPPQNLLMDRFSYSVYKNNLNEILSDFKI